MDQAHTLTLDSRSVAYESQVARHLARHALLIAPAVVAIAALFRGVGGAVSAAIGLALVAANFLISARIIAWAAGRSVGAIYGAVFGGFFVRLAVLTCIVLLLEPVALIDIPVLVLTLAITHFALLVWETRYVSLTLAAPGLKPGVVSASKDKE